MYGHSYGHLCRKAFAVALSVAVLYTLCTLLYIYFPEKAAMLTAQLHMMRPEVISPMISISWTSYLSGVAQIFVMVYLLIMLICFFKGLLGCCHASCQASCCAKNSPNINNPGNNCHRM